MSIGGLEMLKKLFVIAIAIIVTILAMPRISSAEPIISSELLYNSAISQDGNRGYVFTLHIYATVTSDKNLRDQEALKIEAEKYLDRTITRFKDAGWGSERISYARSFEPINLSIEIEIKRGFGGKEVWAYDYIREPDRTFAPRKFSERSDDWGEFVDKLIAEVRTALKEKYKL